MAVNILKRMMGLSLLASLGFVALLSLAQTDAALAGVAVAPTLGVAEQFGALGNSGVTGSAAPGTAVSGDVGSGPTTFAISNFPPSSAVLPFIVHPTSDAVVNQAQADAGTAYLFLSGQLAGNTALGNNLSGLTLTPGLYSSGAANLGASTTLTLNDPSPGKTGIFVFNVASTLVMNGSSVVTGTADPCNVYWRVGSSATLNGLSFMGTVIANTSISTSGGGNVTGRLLAGAVTGTGVVTMATGGNTIGGCSLNEPLVIGAVAPTVGKSFNPPTISAGGTSTLTFTLSNSSIDTPDTITTLTDNLPPGMVIANVPNVSNTCGGVVTALAGGNTVLLTGGTIPVATLIPATAGTCTVSVDVTATVGGTNTLHVGDLVTNNGNNAEESSATLTTGGNVTPVPTLNEWGVIIFMVLAGLVSVYYLRKYRRV